MKTAYIGLGSNLGDSLRIVREGWEMLGRVHGIQLCRLSHPYRTEPVGMVSHNWFINAAGSIRTSLSPQGLLAELHRIEQLLGRRRDPAAKGYRDRTLDLDLLLFDQAVSADNAVRIPHPSMPERLFVLLPLAEIAADAIHPVLGKSIADLLALLKKSGMNPVVEQVDWPEGGVGSLLPRKE